MRFLTFPLALFAAAFISVVPVSAQVVPTMQAGISNARGYVASCPVTINFVGKITFAPSVAANANRQVQYKWIGNYANWGNGQETQTLMFPAGRATTQTVTTTLVLPPAPPVSISAPGNPLHPQTPSNPIAFWAALQISYPTMSNNTSNKAAFTLTCPTTGFLENPNPLNP